MSANRFKPEAREQERTVLGRPRWPRTVSCTIAVLLFIVAGFGLYHWLTTQETLRPMEDAKRATERALNQAGLLKEELRQRNVAEHAMKQAEPVLAKAERQESK